MSKEVQEKTGYLSGDVKFQEFEASGKKLSTFQIGVSTGVGDSKSTEWVSVRAWDEMAEKIKDFKKGLKVSVKGNPEVYKDKPVLNATEINEHRLIQDKELTVGLVEFKQPKNVELVEVVLYDNSPEGKDTKYSVSGFQENLAKVKELDLKPGDKIKLNGDVEVVNYLDKNQEPKISLQGKIYGIELLERAKEKTTENTTETKKEETKAEGKKTKKATTNSQEVNM